MKSQPRNDGTPEMEASQKSTSRRTFLSRLWVCLGVVALAEWIAVGAAFLRRGKADQVQDSNAVLICGPVDTFQPGSVTAFVRGRFYLSRLKDGGFMAISRQCTHLGCTVPWLAQEGRFACPCHASAFDIKGQVVNAPAQRALDIYPVTIENSIVAVDVRHPVKRSEFKRGQVVYPDSS